MADELKVSLGVRTNGSVVHVTELNGTRDRGLGCNCTCAGCGDRLVARLGRVRQHHFAHHTVRHCVGAEESALHRFAKDVFSRHERFMVPDVTASWEDQSITVAPAQYVNYTMARLEERVGGLVPDITLVRVNERPPILVEILVTHEVDENKVSRLRELGLPCIQIDLSEIHVGLDEFKREDIEDTLINGHGYMKQWLCYPNEDQYTEQARKKYQRAQDEKRRRAEALVLKEQQKLEWLRRTEQKRRKKQDELLSAERLERVSERWLRELPDDPLWKRNCRILGVTTTNIPYYLNETLDGEYLFRCHRAIWQSTLFISWVFNKADTTRSQDIHVEFAVDNMKRQHPELLQKELFWAFRDRSDIVSMGDVIGNYFKRLAEYGFAHFFDGFAHNPYSWVFECDRPRTVALPPEYNNRRYLPREDGVHDTKTDADIKF